MYIQSINFCQQHGYAKKNLKKAALLETQTGNANVNENQPTFRGAKGGTLGILAGAAIGAIGAAAIIATGGLAGVVAAAGYTSTVAAGAASCTHIGGIAGSLIEDGINHKDK